jgi:hypothetical protein
MECLSAIFQIVPEDLAHDVFWHLADAGAIDEIHRAFQGKCGSAATLSTRCSLAQALVMAASDCDFADATVRQLRAHIEAYTGPFHLAGVATPSELWSFLHALFSWPSDSIREFLSSMCGSIVGIINCPEFAEHPSPLPGRIPVLKLLDRLCEASQEHCGLLWESGFPTILVQHIQLSDDEDSAKAALRLLTRLTEFDGRAAEAVIDPDFVEGLGQFKPVLMGLGVHIGYLVFPNPDDPERLASWGEYSAGVLRCADAQQDLTPGDGLIESRPAIPDAPLGRRFGNDDEGNTVDADPFLDQLDAVPLSAGPVLDQAAVEGLPAPAKLFYALCFALWSEAPQSPPELPDPHFFLPLACGLLATIGSGSVPEGPVESLLRLLLRYLSILDDLRTPYYFLEVLDVIGVGLSTPRLSAVPSLEDEEDVPHFQPFVSLAKEGFGAAADLLNAEEHLRKQRLLEPTDASHPSSLE